MPIKTDRVFKQLMNKGEEAAVRITNQVFSNEKFMAGLQQVIVRAMNTKEVVDANVQQVLSSISIPSTADIKKSHEKLGNLEEQVDGLNEKLTRIEKKLDSLASSIQRAGKE